MSDEHSIQFDSNSIPIRFQFDSNSIPIRFVSNMFEYSDDYLNGNLFDVVSCTAR